MIGSVNTNESWLLLTILNVSLVEKMYGSEAVVDEIVWGNFIFVCFKVGSYLIASGIRCWFDNIRFALVGFCRVVCFRFYVLYRCFLCFKLLSLDWFLNIQ